jgi:hypothetical protein
MLDIDDLIFGSWLNVVPISYWSCRLFFIIPKIEIVFASFTYVLFPFRQGGMIILLFSIFCWRK